MRLNFNWSKWDHDIEKSSTYDTFRKCFFYFSVSSLFRGRRVTCDAGRRPAHKATVVPFSFFIGRQWNYILLRRVWDDDGVDGVDVLGQWQHIG